MADHQHTGKWAVEPDGIQWIVEARCEVCGFVDFTCTARTEADLQLALTVAFHENRIGASSYFNAPVLFPDQRIPEALG